MTLLAHNPAETQSGFLFGLILVGVIGLLFLLGLLGGLLLLIRSIWQVLKKERPPK